MAGRVDDVDARVLPQNRCSFRQNGDAAFAFEIVRVHDALGDALIFAKGAGSLQQAIDESRLAMVDMRDDRDIAELHDLRLLEEARSARSGCCYAIHKLSHAILKVWQATSHSHSKLPR